MSKKTRRNSTSAAAPQSFQQMMSGEYDVKAILDNFWPSQMDKIEDLPSSAFRDQRDAQELPLARIKKIMKLDDEVKNQMISAEAPVLFAKAAEIFIEELTLRAWVHTEENKRKTLQKNDIAMAISKHDQFDFLIDIVPREEIRPSSRKTHENAQYPHASASSGSNVTATATATALSTTDAPALLTDRHFFIQLAGPPQLSTPQTVQLQNGQILQATPIGQPVQLVTGPNGELQLVQPQQQHQPTNQNQAQQQQQEQLPQVFQQIIAADGTIQHVPLQLSPAQLQYLKAQFGGTSGTGTSGGTVIGQQRSGGE